MTSGPTVVAEPVSSGSTLRKRMGHVPGGESGRHPDVLGTNPLGLAAVTPYAATPAWSGTGVAWLGRVAVARR